MKLCFLFFGGDFIYTVSDVASICNVSSQSINKRIRNFSDDQKSKFLVALKPDETRQKLINEDGLLYFKSVYHVSDVSDSSGLSDHDLIVFLKDQIRIKDEQIEMLMDQNRNFQILLKSEQDRVSDKPRISFVRRLFGRSSAD